jgi:hypothetical protein
MIFGGVQLEKQDSVLILGLQQTTFGYQGIALLTLFLSMFPINCK